MDSQAQQRLAVLAHVLAGELSLAEAAAMLCRSERQLRRIVGRFALEGGAALVHGNRGRSPSNRISEADRARIVELARGELAGFNPVHLTETMAELGGPSVSARSVRRILAGEQLVPPRTRRPPAHRRRRERMPRAGMILQADGSRHDWLEGRGPLLSLVTGIDDATSVITAAVFRDQEDAAGYLLMLLQTARHHGLPDALYTDRHGIFMKDANRPPSLVDQLAGRRRLTQVGRALDEAGIAWIGARSAPAKGRVERSNGTLQDRLVSELRRARVSSLDAANDLLGWFLPRHNAHFGVEPALPEPAWREWPLSVPPEAVFAFHYPRTVGRDATISWAGDSLALPERTDRRSWAGRRIVVQERLDGSLWAAHEGLVVPLLAAPAAAPVLRARKLRHVPDPASPPEPVEPTTIAPIPSAHSVRPPKPTHPWRLYPPVRPR